MAGKSGLTCSSESFEILVISGMSRPLRGKGKSHTHRHRHTHIQTHWGGSNSLDNWPRSFVLESCHFTRSVLVVGFADCTLCQPFYSLSQHVWGKQLTQYNSLQLWRSLWIKLKELYLCSKSESTGWTLSRKSISHTADTFLGFFLFVFSLFLNMLNHT